MLVIGQGRSGKSGFCFEYIDESGKAHKVEGGQSEKWIILAPDITHERMIPLDKITDSDSPDESFKEKISRAYQESKTHLLIHCVNENEELFEILSSDEFYGAKIYGDDIATLLSTPELKKSFKRYLRKVGWKNQILLLSSHRLTDDLPTVASLLVREVYWVGPLADKDEVTNLYRKGNLAGAMTEKQLGEKLAVQTKFPWWEKGPTFEQKQVGAVTAIKIS